MYSNDEDKTDGMWVYFYDGHTEYWNNTRLSNELQYRGLQFIKTQMILKAKQIFKEVKEANVNNDEIGDLPMVMSKFEFKDIKHRHLQTFASQKEHNRN